MNLRKYIIYVAGPYRAKTEWEVNENARRAEKTALDLWEAGFTVHCPHKNTERFGGARGLPDHVWLDGDLETIKRCDAVLLMPGWESSEGTKLEKEYAYANNIPAFQTIKHLTHYFLLKEAENDPN